MTVATTDFQPVELTVALKAGLSVALMAASKACLMAVP
jgi:hypothetical protein